MENNVDIYNENDEDDIIRKQQALRRVLSNKYIWQVIRSNFDYSKNNKRSGGSTCTTVTLTFAPKQKPLVIKRYAEIDLKWIAENGYFHLIRDKYKKHGYDWLRTNCTMIAASNCKPIVKGLGQIDSNLVKVIYSLCRELFNLSCHVIDAASEIGNIELLQYFHGETRGRGGVVSYTDTAVHLAAMNGHLDALNFLYQYGYKYNSDNRHTISDGAASRGHLQVVKKEGYTVKAIDAAATNGHFNVVKHLGRINRKKFTIVGLNGALENRHTAIFKYLVELNNIPMSHHIRQFTKTAAQTGQLDILKYLYESTDKDSKIPTDTLFYALQLAVSNCQEDVVKYLIDKVPVDRTTNEMNGIIDSLISHGFKELAELIIVHFSHLNLSLADHYR
ncbi:hypothetical protein PPL_06701 [Heterostelium album PN500]|uniref:Ankyrin repeat protein n=1 Tax=Heterostelium pallidum (strain ATCC 26659 / Pp 5 / PN500) TaxID=670386 RepID=D3BFG7_HETP5|nr:hypothetical protein PPL_06701 [Heterostelium album PN500]EFA79881.1 hypothetical protein PPL_06701 [Heterostelium album PN500]|eukprot:XP_020432002.1 hypothetical protein PPL_06701 [Heterostelium album PN500]